MADFTEFQSISFSVDGMGQVQGLVKALEAEEKALSKAEAATTRASKAKGQFARDALQASHAAQDFATAGLLGIGNNLDSLGRIAGRIMPGLAAFFGGPTGLAAAAMGAGVAIYALQRPVEALVTWITSEGNGIPKATGAVERLDERLGEVKARLKEVKEAWDGSATSVAEVNRLTGEQIDLEKKLTAAKKERAAVDAQRDKENAATKELTSAVSDAVKKAGGVDKVAADLAGAMPGAGNAAQAQLDQLIRERNAAVAAGPSPFRKGEINASYRPQIAAAEEAVRQARGQAQAGASGLLGRALQGDKEAIQQMERFLPGRNFGLVPAAAAMPDVTKGILKGFGEGSWEEQHRGGRMAKDVADLRKAGAATAAGMLGGFNAGAGVENGEGGEVAKALAPFQKADVNEAMEAFDRGTRGGFSEDESDALAGAQGVVNRASTDFKRSGRVDRVSSNEVERALSEASRAMDMQLTDPAPDMRVIGELSRVSAELVRVKQQLNNQARQGQQLRGQSWQGPATGNFISTPYPF